MPFIINDFSVEKVKSFILKDIEYKQKKEQYNLELWMFGSALNKKNPNDIDILLLYPIETKDIKGIYGFKQYFKSNMEKYFNIDVDILLLSYEEENEINFKVKENCIFLF
ncbi:nucleotidyltransferase domain-containing protein [Clostridium perfringens]|uniref:nucleotidyltransferase domain-containing protein n=1 Tax=Clostridium perfringens TaxID=1502 RepID=UPI000F531ED4|nr:nucleotidyltransferase domain-containing protein [Clostridium perfringens]